MLEGGTLIGIGTAKAAAGVLAAYWLGCLIGATIYAAQMCTIGDSWMDSFANADVRAMLNQAQRYELHIPQSVARNVALARSVQNANGVLSA